MVKKQESVWIVVPAYNEEKKIGKVIDDLITHNYSNIVVVNDGSTDNTKKIAEDKGVVVINHRFNKGQGAALRAGTNYTLKKGAEIIVHFDADGQMSSKEILSLITPIFKKEVDITLGSRFLREKTKIPTSRRLILYLGKIFLKFLGVRFSDPQCGFRAMSKEAMKKIKIKEDGPEHATEILLEIFKKGLKYREIPVTIKYSKYLQKKSQHGKFPFFSGLKIAFKIVYKRLTSRFS